MEKIPQDIKDKIEAELKECIRQAVLADNQSEEYFKDVWLIWWGIGSTAIKTGLRNCLYKKESQIESLRKENEELKAWKESMLSVMPPIQEIGKAIGVKLGETVHDKILPFIEQAKSALSHVPKIKND